MAESAAPGCPHKKLERRVIDEVFDYGLDDERIEVAAKGVPVMVCAACGEVFYGPEAEQSYHRAICAALGLLTPEEIKGVRERLGMTQEAFAKLTGIGVATLSRWERGQMMQSRAMDRYLKLISRLPEAAGVLEKDAAMVAA